MWDATVVDTFSQGHYKDSARQAGFAATKAEAAKCQKYHDLQSNFHFQPVAIETTGVYGKSTAPILNGLAKKLVDVSVDPRERQWLHQRLSLQIFLVSKYWVFAFVIMKSTVPENAVNQV